MPKTSEKYREAEARLPEHLRPIFGRLVDEYEYIAQLRYGRGYVSYDVLADLVMAGWRPSAESEPESKL
jgi:hypothetical protein